MSQAQVQKDPKNGVTRHKKSESTVDNLITLPSDQVSKMMNNSQEVDLAVVLKNKKITLPKNWGMTTGTANWNMKSKATTLVKRLSQSQKLSDKVIAIEQYKSSFDKFCKGKVGSQEEITQEVIDHISSFLREVSIKFGVSEGTLDNLLDHFAET